MSCCPKFLWYDSPRWWWVQWKKWCYNWQHWCSNKMINESCFQVSCVIFPGPGLQIGLLNMISMASNGSHTHMLTLPGLPLVPHNPQQDQHAQFSYTVVNSPSLCSKSNSLLLASYFLSLSLQKWRHASTIWAPAFPLPSSPLKITSMVGCSPPPWQGETVRCEHCCCIPACHHHPRCHIALSASLLLLWSSCLYVLALVLCLWAVVVSACSPCLPGSSTIEQQLPPRCDGQAVEVVAMLWCWGHFKSARHWVRKEKKKTYQVTVESLHMKQCQCGSQYLCEYKK